MDVVILDIHPRLINLHVNRYVPTYFALIVWVLVFVELAHLLTHPTLGTNAS